MNIDKKELIKNILIIIVIIAIAVICVRKLTAGETLSEFRASSQSTITSSK